MWLFPQRDNAASSLSVPLNHCNCMKPGWVNDDPVSPVSSAFNKRLKYHLWEHRDDFSSLLDTVTYFPACINIFFSSSSRRSGIYAIQNKGKNDGLLSLVFGGQKTLILLCLRTSLIPLLLNGTFFKWAFQNCPANPHFGQTDRVAKVTVCRSKGIRRVIGLINSYIHR